MAAQQPQRQPAHIAHLIVLNAAGLPGAYILAFSHHVIMGALSIILAVVLIVFNIWWLSTQRHKPATPSS